MGDVLTLGQMLAVHHRLQPDRIGARDLDREMTFGQWNERACRLANGFAGLGLEKGDRVAVLAYNCIEWVEIFVAGAKAGLVVVPLNFRLIGKEIRYILEDAGAAALIVEDQLAGVDRGGPRRVSAFQKSASSSSARSRNVLGWLAILRGS